MISLASTYAQDADDGEEAKQKKIEETCEAALEEKTVKTIDECKTNIANIRRYIISKSRSWE